MIGGLVLTSFRLYRAQIVVTAALLAVLASVAVADALTMASVISHSGQVGGCHGVGCDDRLNPASDPRPLFDQVLPYVGLLPAGIGAFWGAPLLGREYETGAIRFSWTQSTTRRTWILTKLLALGSLVALGAIVLGAAVDYRLSVYSGSILSDAVEADFGFGHVRGTAPVGWWLFGFTLGAVSGAVFRRTIPAIVFTVITIVAALIGRNLWYASYTAGRPLSTAPQLQHVETASLIILSALLAVATCWSVEHARG